MSNGQEETPDELQNLVSELDAAGPAAQQGTEETPSPAAQDLERRAQAQGTDAHGALLAGRFKSPKDLEKSYLSLRKQYDPMSQKMKQLDTILRNPKLHEWASKDPEIVQALAKAGYELAETEEVQRTQGQEEFDEKNPMHHLRLEVETLKETNRLQWQYGQFTSKLGRQLSKEEHGELMEVYGNIPGITVEQAWKLTSAYEKSVLAERQKAVAEAQKKLPGIQRPKPLPHMLPGEKLNLQKPVGEMNEQEQAAKLMEIINQNP